MAKKAGSRGGTTRTKIAGKRKTLTRTKPRTKRATGKKAKRAGKAIKAMKAKAAKPLARRPSGYAPRASGVLVPNTSDTVVPASKLRTGFTKARKEIDKLVQDIVDAMTEEYVIQEIELAASFSADGKFLGIGVGGAATITIRIAPDRHGV